MAKIVYKAKLNPKSLNELCKNLENYKDVILQQQIDLFMNKLLDRGITRARLSMGMLEDLGNVSGLVALKKEINPVVDGWCSAILVATDQAKVVQSWLKFGEEVQAEVSPILMYEFGSGKYAIEGHRGTFPQQTHAFEEYWSWQDLNGQWHSFDGIKPTQPMYHSAEEMRKVIGEVAKEVF